MPALSFVVSVIEPNLQNKSKTLLIFFFFFFRFRSFVDSVFGAWGHLGLEAGASPGLRTLRLQDVRKVWWCHGQWVPGGAAGHVRIQVGKKHKTKIFYFRVSLLCCLVASKKNIPDFRSPVQVLKGEGKKRVLDLCGFFWEGLPVTENSY